MAKLVELQPTPARWLGAVLRSESDRPVEWPLLAAVICNRVKAKGWPDTLVGVLRQRWQFSALNSTAHMGDDEAWIRLLDTYAGESVGDPENDLVEAIACAEHFLRLPRWSWPVAMGPGVCNYYSPESMKPPYRVPDWNWLTLRAFTVPGIDPARFVFAETVSPRHPHADNVREVAPLRAPVVPGEQA